MVAKHKAVTFTKSRMASSIYPTFPTDPPIKQSKRNWPGQSAMFVYRQYAAAESLSMFVYFWNAGCRPRNANRKRIAIATSICSSIVFLFVDMTRKCFVNVMRCVMHMIEMM